MALIASRTPRALSSERLLRSDSGNTSDPASAPRIQIILKLTSRGILMNIKAWFNSSPPKLGTLLTIDHPAIVEIARLAGFDWLWIDAEHGHFNDISASVACAVNAGGPPAFVR